MDGEDQRSGRKGDAKGADARERLAAALRDNLRKRKAQARERCAGEGRPSSVPDEGTPALKPPEKAG